MTQEIPVVFDCYGDPLLGMIHQAAAPKAAHGIGVLIIVGGPQYRVGSHRQFVLLARALAAAGIPVMRFDYRGMGDAGGVCRSFDQVDEDIKAALAAFMQHCPEVTSLVLWGLCDAASAAAFYAYQDPLVKGVVLLNPWVFTAQGAAKTTLKHYYLQRLLSRELWRKVLTLQFDYRQSLLSLQQLLATVLGKPAAEPNKTTAAASTLATVAADLPLPVRLRSCLQHFRHPGLLILSGRDLTADEFREAVASDPAWQQLLQAPSLQQQTFAAADHTFSCQAWRQQVEAWTVAWLNSLPAKVNSQGIIT